MLTASRVSERTADEAEIPGFVPHPFLRNGHVQTVVGRYCFGSKTPLASETYEINVDGGDRIVVHESIPANWKSGGPLALLVHGLAGCARSPYMIRVAARLHARGVRVVRMNLRGAGAGFGLARGIYHAGRSEDLRRVVEWMADRARGSPVGLLGFSLGANLVLKLAAEATEQPLAGLDCVLAANPPLDLAACCQHIQRPSNRVYDRNFVRLLRKDVTRLHAAFPDLGPVELPKVMTLLDFDDAYTAPRNGFAGAEDYYRRSSAGPLIPRIRVPGLVVHAEDDPFIPAAPFRNVTFPPNLALELISSGGHLGYLSRGRWMGDRRWLDSRFTAWLSSRWALN